MIVPSWKSSGLRLLKFCLVGSIGLISSPGLIEAQQAASLPITMTLQGIRSYSDFQEIQATLGRSEKVEKISIWQEAPGLILMNMHYVGEAKGLIETFSVLFPDKYSLKEKSLRGGRTEIVLKRK